MLWRHRNFFELHALDAVLGDLGRAGKVAIESAMKGHVVAHAELVGMYRR